MIGIGVIQQLLFWFALIAISLAWGGSTAMADDPRLSSLTIKGSDTVNENSSANYTASAVYSDGEIRTVTTRASWSEDSANARISSGTLQTGSVSEDTTVTISARYSRDGVTRTARKTVTIRDAAATTLQSISIGGPGSVGENSSTAFPVTALMSDGSTRAVTASMSEDSQFATFSGNTLITTGVSANQTVNITASYSESSITKTATKNVTITDGASPAPSLGGSHAGRFSAYEGTKTCLECHTEQAIQVYNSEHYQWAGKLGAINDFCIYPDPNLIGKLTNTEGTVVDGGCMKCHPGQGAKPTKVASPTEADLINIDCLTCHAPKYKRTVDPVTKANYIPDEDAMGMTILEAAVDIRPTTRDTCLNCHTKSGGGDNFKRGDIEEHHRNPATRSFDVHMSSQALGGGDLHCTRCHTVNAHKISGKGMDLRVEEGAKVDCTNCHGANPPHSNSSINSRHLQRVHCTTCHIPSFAKVAQTDMHRDWSAPGELNTSTFLYDPARTMQGNVTPSYRWWDGKNSTIYKFGAPATPGADGSVLMAGPTGSISTAGSKIYPVKIHTASQPIDTLTKYLLPLKIGRFYMEGDLVNAVPLGQDAVGWSRNPYDFQSTTRVMGLFHQVSPKENALGYNNACTTCHGSTNPRIPLKTIGYAAKKPTSDLCNDCHDSESYSFTRVHPRHSNEGIDCSGCHNFSKAR